MSQKWEDLVMAHYSEEASAIQSSLPDDLIADTFEGRAWFSVVAFRLTNLCIRPFTFLRWPDFWEINLRTYVRDKEGNRGVWFYSLDSSDLFGVIGARLLYGLRYNFARIGRTGSASGKKMITMGKEARLPVPQLRRSGKIRSLSAVHQDRWIISFWSVIGFGQEEDRRKIPLRHSSDISPTNP